MLRSGRLHLETEVDRFAAAEPIAVRENLAEVRFRLESQNPAPHSNTVRLAGLPAGAYRVWRDHEVVTSFDAVGGEASLFDVPVNGTDGSGLVRVMGQP